MSRVLVAMSGGVDSSVAAWLLRQQGHDVVGVFLRHGQAAEACTIASKQGCCSAADADDARRVADRLGIPFYALNCEGDFARIIDYFVDEYLRGRTPNPCVVCNTWLKFGRLFEYAAAIGAERIATGHYARRLSDGDGRPGLFRGIDPTKDQSYVLFGIESARLAGLCLPLGGYRKEEIRKLAAEARLPVAEKPDSQEICFVPDRRHAEFVRLRRPQSQVAGEIVTTGGEVVGRHDGLARFTVGQRKGLGLAFGAPRYVVRLEAETGRVVIGEKEELARTRLTAAAVNWLAPPPAGPLACEAMVRYRSRPAAATVSPLEDGRVGVELHQPAYGVAPGQAVVFYAGEQVLGGGWIE